MDFVVLAISCRAGRAMTDRWNIVCHRRGVAAGAEDYGDREGGGGGRSSRRWGGSGTSARM